MDDPLRTALYVRHQTAADLAHWSPARDIAWERTPVGHANPEQTAVLRAAVLEEAATLGRLAHLIGRTVRNPDAGLSLAILAQETGKHFHALRLYLDRAHARPPLSEREIERARTRYLDGLVPEPVEGLVAVLRGAHLGAHHYRTLAARDRGSVLSDLLRLIAADKVRHGRMIADLLEDWVGSDRRIAPRVRAATDRWDQGNEHPRVGPEASGVVLRTLRTRLDRIGGLAPRELEPAFSIAG